ncbi:MAG TPA: RNA polymerase sigma factor ShbA [Micromonosporaceae bacterium]
MSSPDADLVRRAVDGDDAAVAKLLADVHPMIVRYCLARLGRIGGSYASAEDVAQEVCLAVLAALPRFQDQGRPFAAFAYGIAARKISETLRAARRRPTSDGEANPDAPDPAAGPEERALAADLSARLLRTLNRLPPIQREVIVLRVAVGLSASEVATMTGLSATGVRVAQHRALKRLRSLAVDLVDEVG